MHERPFPSGTSACQRGRCHGQWQQGKAGSAMMDKVAAFAVLSLILTVTPGPDGLLVLRSSLLGGRRAGVRVAAGAASGSLAWGLFSAAGLTALLAASAQAYRAVQLAGACYLVFLGIRGWRATAGHEPSQPRHSPRFW